MAVRQTSLFASGDPTVDLGARFERIVLDDRSWVDLARSWLIGSDAVLDGLIADVAWRQRRRRMYDRIVDEPRLTRWYGAAAELPDPTLDTFRSVMAARYRVGFGPLGLNHYRHGGDSVAFHADRELRHLDDTLVAILTLGATRPFLVRPTGGGASVDLRPGPGDVLVMGGACQARFEHAVPKISRPVGPRISASIRWVRR